MLIFPVNGCAGGCLIIGGRAGCSLKTARKLTTLRWMCSHAQCGQFKIGKQGDWQEHQVFHTKEAMLRERDTF